MGACQEEKDLVSVIMSVYNDEKYLHESIDSILKQTYSNLEFLILDDCSTDNSLKIITDYSLSDSRIRIFKNKKNKGLTKNLNFLIKSSRGDYIARMDADDISTLNRIRIQVDRFKENSDLDVLGGSAHEFINFKTLLTIRTYPTTFEGVKKQICMSSPLCHPTVMFKKSVFENGVLYNEKYKTTQDLELWFRLIINNYVISNMPEVLIYFRLNPDLPRRRSRKKAINEFKIYTRGIFKMFGFSFRLVFPFVRLFTRLLPNLLIEKIYKSNIRSVLNSK